MLLHPSVKQDKKRILLIKVVHGIVTQTKGKLNAFWSVLYTGVRIVSNLAWNVNKTKYLEG